MALEEIRLDNWSSAGHSSAGYTGALNLNSYCYLEIEQPTFQRALHGNHPRYLDSEQSRSFLTPLLHMHLPCKGYPSVEPEDRGVTTCPGTSTRSTIRHQKDHFEIHGAFVVYIYSCNA